MPHLSVVRWARRLWVPAALSGIVLVVTYAAVGLSSSLEPTMTALLINLAIVIGLYVFAGNSGILSFGHISFMAIAAYVWAILTIPLALKTVFLPNEPYPLSTIELASPIAFVVAALVAAGVAFFVALPVMRLSGIAASISTFAFLVVTQIVIANWDTVTKGRTTMVGMPLDTTLGKVVVWTVVILFIAYAFQESRIGLRLRASREDEVAARAIGISVYKERVIAFVLSAFIVGSAGPLFGGFVGAFTPSSFYIDSTVITMAMLVVGGVNSLSGAVIGTFTVSLASEILRRLEGGVDLGSVHIPLPIGLPQVGVGLLMLLILILRPKGITGNAEVPWPGRAATGVVRLRMRFLGAREAPELSSDASVSEASSSSKGKSV
jgi:branched-chain amino acid transport system permease protein